MSRLDVQWVRGIVTSGIFAGLGKYLCTSSVVLHCNKEVAVALIVLLGILERQVLSSFPTVSVFVVPVAVHSLDDRVRRHCGGS